MIRKFICLLLGHKLWSDSGARSERWCGQWEILCRRCEKWIRKEEM